MADTLLTIHWFVRYLVLVAGIVAAVAALIAWRKGKDGVDRPLGAAFTGLLDVQVLLGVVLLTQRPFYGALMGHITMMVVAAIVAHVGSVIARRRAPTRPGALIRFVTIVASLALIVGGIASIGRPVL